MRSVNRRNYLLSLIGLTHYSPPSNLFKTEAAISPKASYMLSEEIPLFSDGLNIRVPGNSKAT